jgi:hypothetical protein
MALRGYGASRSPAQTHCHGTKNESNPTVPSTELVISCLLVVLELPPWRYTLYAPLVVFVCACMRHTITPSSNSRLNTKHNAESPQCDSSHHRAHSFIPHRQFPHGRALLVNPDGWLGRLACTRRPSVDLFVKKQGEMARP